MCVYVFFPHATRENNNKNLSFSRIKLFVNVFVVYFISSGVCMLDDCNNDKRIMKEIKNHDNR